MTATASDAPAVAHFRFFELEVLRTRRLGHSFLRVTFGGESLAGFRSGGFDQSLSLFLPASGQEHTVLPSTDEDTWFTAWRGMPDEERPVMRSYTVREQRRTPEGADEVDIDFVLHGDSSPASRWAGRAVVEPPDPGDRTGRRGEQVRTLPAMRPRPTRSGCTRTRPPCSAAAAILDRLPAGTRVTAWFEVPHEDDRLDLRAPADADITWIVRESDGRERTERVLGALRAAGPAAAVAPYAWLAGEAGTIRAVRRHFVQERSVDRRAVRFTGYWRLGASEEQLLAEAYAGKAPSEDPASEL